MAAGGRTSYSEFGRLLSDLPHQAVYLPERVPVIYADGLAGVGLGSSVARLSLIQVVHVEETNPPKEIRQVSAQVVLPITAMIELVTNVLRGLKSNPQLDEQMHAGVNTVLAALNNISISD
jgi:hypothetical protein